MKNKPLVILVLQSLFQIVFFRSRSDAFMEWLLMVDVFALKDGVAAIWILPLYQWSR
jgi:hypothetical protein